MPSAAPPLIGVTACIRSLGRISAQRVSAKYIRAVIEGIGGQPVIIPALPSGDHIASIIASLDGILLTGSPSNVEPHHYGGAPSRPGTLHDPHRDGTTLPLIRMAVAAGRPILALCRGHQELNVALGGTLHQDVHELPGKRDHRAPADQPNEIRYAPAHPIRLHRGGVLAELTSEHEVQVNSLHAQAIDRPAAGLAIEAVSSDEVIEAVRLTGAPGFGLGIQWHPEWSIATNPFSAAIFAAMGTAAREYALSRRSSRKRLHV